MLGSSGYEPIARSWSELAEMIEKSVHYLIEGRIKRYVDEELGEDIAIAYCVNNKDRFSDLEECKKEVRNKFENEAKKTDDFNRIFDFVMYVHGYLVVKRAVREYLDKLAEPERVIKRVLRDMVIEDIIEIMLSPPLDQR